MKKKTEVKISLDCPFKLAANSMTSKNDRTGRKRTEGKGRWERVGSEIEEGKREGRKESGGKGKLKWKVGEGWEELTGRKGYHGNRQSL